MTVASKYLRRDPSEVRPWAETCGQIRPLIEAADGAAAEVHHVEIDAATLHYHEHTDEVYYIIAGSGTMVLDDDEIEVHPGGSRVRPEGDSAQGGGELNRPDSCIPRGVLDDIHELE